MTHYPTRASILLRLTLLGGCVLSVTASASAQSVGDGLEQVRFIAAIDDAVFTDDAGSRREDSIRDATRDTTTLLQRAALRESLGSQVTRLALEIGEAAGGSAKVSNQQPVTQNRSWVQRHPTLFGALVGAGLGAVSSLPRWNELYCASGGDEECLFHGASGVAFGAGVGAGIGALVGHWVGK
jgi:hypothetical protein